MKRYGSIVLQLFLFLGFNRAGNLSEKDYANSNEAFVVATASDLTVFVPEDVSKTESIVQLTISARNFPPNTDTMCIVLKNSDTVPEWIEYTRTEIVERSGDPDFVKKIILEDTFEEYIQPLLFKCYKIGMTSLLLKDDDLIGFASVTLGKMDYEGPETFLKLEQESEVSTLPTSSSTGLWWAYNKKRRLRETGEADSGKPYIILKKEKLMDHNTKQNFNRIALVLRGSNILVPLRNKSSSYLEIYQAIGDSDAADCLTLIVRIGMSELVTGRSLSIPTLEVDPELNLKFVCKYQCERSQRRRIVGEFETSVDEIENDGRRTFELRDPRIRKSDLKYENSGVIQIIEYRGIYHSFLEYIKGGLEIHFNFGIDFTNSHNTDHLPINSSNEVQSSKKSSPMNHFERAIYALVSIIEEYDADKKFPVLGFGGQFFSHEEESVFYVDPVHQFCSGINGVLDAYRRCLSRIKVAKSAHVAPIIRHVVNEYIRGYDYDDNYFVLLILTADGRIKDMDDTKSIIEEATELPLSIIIVGIGETEFEPMAKLGAHSALDRQDGADARAERDILHFIAFDRFLPTTKKRLTKELMAEVPRQLVTYMANRHLKPKSPRLNSAELPPHPAYL